MAKFAGAHIICCVTWAPGADEHHILTQKSHPEYANAPWNKIPLSHQLHVQAHQKGMTWMAKEYIGVHNWLVEHGWVYCGFSRRWVHPETYKEDMN